MDHIVKAAMAKWPNVPACTGWLALDRRGRFRMRDTACQAAGAPGEPIQHAALNAFIARNYTADAEGRWFFQNGPQRVFVDLDYAPLVVRLHHGTAGHHAGTAHPEPILIDQCSLPFIPSACWCDAQGSILFAGRRGTVTMADADIGSNADTTRDAALDADVDAGGETVALLCDQDLDLFLTLFPDAAQQLASLLEAASSTPDTAATQRNTSLPSVAGGDVTAATATDTDRIASLPGRRAEDAALYWPGNAIALRCGLIDAKDVPARFGFRPRPTV
jgi:hypothetical protein